MWNEVSELAGFVLFILLFNLCWIIFEIPEWLEKVLKRRGRKSRMETRIATLERRILELEQKMVTSP
jgi:hypothetical protein